MKEIKILEGWADNITNEARLGTPIKTIGDRPLPRPQDVQYKASRMFPDRSPEQALQLYVSQELENNEKTDLEQNKMINSTMKMVRSKVEERYTEEIKFAYTPEGKNIYNKFNLG